MDQFNKSPNFVIHIWKTHTTVCNGTVTNTHMAISFSIDIGQTTYLLLLTFVDPPRLINVICERPHSARFGKILHYSICAIIFN